MIFAGKTRSILFRIFQALALLAALYHIISIFYPLDDSPYWRHMVFAAVCFFTIYGLERRTLYFTFFIGLLLIQQYYSHGYHLIQTWTNSRQIHWISLFVLLALPVLLICLVEEQRGRKV